MTGKFLVNNYLQALEILKSENTFEDTLNKQGIEDPSVFVQWLVEEKEYLEKLSSEPPEETLEMDYYTALVNLLSHQYVDSPLFPIYF